MGGDPEANYLHYGIQKLHWPPSEIKIWLELSEEERAFICASTDIRTEKEKEEADKLNKR